MKFIDRINKIIENNRSELDKVMSLKENKEYYVSNLASGISKRITELSGKEASDPTEVLLTVINESPSILSKSFDSIDTRARDLTVVLHTVELVKREYNMFLKETEEREKNEKRIEELVEAGTFEKPRKTGARPEKLKDIRNTQEKIKKKKSQSKKKKE